MSDEQRINFLLSRETDSKNVTHFAIQSIKQYRKANLSAKRKYGKLHTYRTRYIQSYLYHKEYLNIVKILSQE